MPWAVFSDNSDILPAVLKDIANCFRSLFQDGVCVDDQNFFFALIGCKGDAEFHVHAGEFLRSYMTVGEVNDNPMCPYCDAHTSNFGDVSDSPCWLPSVTCPRTNDK